MRSFFHQNRQLGNAPIIAVLMITVAVGGYITYSQMSTRQNLKSANEVEAYNAGVDANKNAITMAKALLEFPDGSLYQDPYYPVSKASINLHPNKSAAGDWKFVGENHIQVKTKTYHKKVTGEDIWVDLVFQTPERGRNWIDGKNGPLLLSIDVVATSKLKVKQLGNVKEAENSLKDSLPSFIEEPIMAKSSLALNTPAFKRHAATPNNTPFSQPETNVEDNKEKAREITVIHKATIGMQRPPMPTCEHHLSAPVNPFPGACGFSPIIMPCPGMFLPFEVLTFTGTPVKTTVTCSGVVSNSVVTAQIGGSSKPIPKYSTPGVPYENAKSVFSVGKDIGSVDIPAYFLEDYGMHYDAAYDAGDPVPEGTLGMAPPSFTLHAATSQKVTIASNTIVSPSTRAKKATITTTTRTEPTKSVTTTSRKTSSSRRAQAPVPSGPIPPLNARSPGTPATAPSNPGGESFIGTTMIKMADGSQKRIDELIVGDYVLNQKTRQPSKVEAVIRRNYLQENLVQVNFLGGEITVTDFHPFYTARGVIVATDLRTDDVLLSENNIELPVISLNKAVPADGRHVYDIMIDFNLAMNDKLFAAEGLKMPDLALMEQLQSKEGFGRWMTPSIANALPQEYQTGLPK